MRMNIQDQYYDDPNLIEQIIKCNEIFLDWLLNDNEFCIIQSLGTLYTNYLRMNEYHQNQVILVNRLLPKTKMPNPIIVF